MHVLASNFDTLSTSLTDSQAQMSTHEQHPTQSMSSATVNLPSNGLVTFAASTGQTYSHHPQLMHSLPMKISPVISAFSKVSLYMHPLQTALIAS